MDTELLRNTAQNLGLKNIKSYYTGGFSLWLESKNQKSFVVKTFVKSIWFIGKVLSKIVRIESKFSSPYIVLYAEK